MKGKSMKLWLLVRTDTVLYDEARGMVVSARDESEARSIAALESGDEGENAWLGALSSTCVVLLPGKKPRMVLQDYLGG